MNEAFDYRRYQTEPRRPLPQLVWNQPKPAPEPAQEIVLVEAPDELLRVLGIAGRALLLAALLLWRRMRAQGERLLQSITGAWIVAGLGWGICIDLCIIQYFTR